MGRAIETLQQSVTPAKHFPSFLFSSSSVRSASPTSPKSSELPDTIRLVADGASIGSGSGSCLGETPTLRSLLETQIFFADRPKRLTSTRSPKKCPEVHPETLPGLRDAVGCAEFDGPFLEDWTRKRRVDRRI